MRWPGDHVGCAEEPEHADIRELVAQFIDDVESITAVKGLLRAAMPILRRPHVYVVADAESVHIVYSMVNGGSIPTAKIFDYTASDPNAKVSGERAVLVVSGTQAWGACAAVTVPRALLHAPEAERREALRAEADEYVEFYMAERERERQRANAQALMDVVPNPSSTLLEGVREAIADVPHEQSVFIMMRYLEGPQYKQIEQVIRKTLQEYGLQARLAKDRSYVPGLWENICVYMCASKYGIAVFDEIDVREFNPSVAIEVGYMYALQRKVLLLKDSRMPKMPTDIVGLTHQSFDSYRIPTTVGRRVGDWVKNDLGLSRMSSTTPRQPQ